MKCEWKDIAGYEGHYQISNYGNVKSLSRTIKNSRYQFGSVKDRTLKQAINTNGYSFVSLRLNGKQKSVSIHRLVAIAFLANPDAKEQVNHINGVKSDNRVENLEWVTRSENVLHAYRSLKRKSSQQGKVGKESFSAIPISQYDMQGNFVAYFESQKDASIKTGVNARSINMCYKRKQKTAGGFVWK